MEAGEGEEPITGLNSRSHDVAEEQLDARF
jgi:hypothetical protein